ncbi:MAG: CHASE2 domain-containing protein [Elusimicrobia bacterium]|nr:CHASE2 domain-containing protein [Elusimicrobiota bacterium]
MKKQGWLADFLIGFVFTLIIIILYFFRVGFFEAFEYKFYDLRCKFRQNSNPGKEIMIVAIDDNSIANIGRWPWPRSIMAMLLMEVAKAEPKVIGLNILFSEPDSALGLEEIRSLKTQYVDMLLKVKKIQKRYKIKTKDINFLNTFLGEIANAEANIDNDTALSDAIFDAEKVVLPMFFQLNEPLGEKAAEIPPILAANSVSGRINSMATQGYSPLLPLDIFAESTKGIGHVNIISDADGAKRKELALIRYQDKYYPSFALQLARIFLNFELSDIKIRNDDKVVVGKTVIPTDSSMFTLINYNGPFGTFKYCNAFDVLTNKIPPEAFRNKIVLIGITATGIADLNVIPLGHSFPGVEITANAIQNIIHNNFIVRPSWAADFEFYGLILCGLFVMLGLPRLKAKWGAILTTVLLLIIVGSGTYIFIQGYWVKIFYLIILLVLGYILITTKHFLFTEKRKELVEAESIETNKMLGLSFQGQGMLDIAFEKFRKCPLDDSMKELLYNLGLDFERKRQFNKAAAVYEHIKKVDPKYKDIGERTETLKSADTAISIGGKAKDTTVIIEGAKQKPTLGRYEVEKELGRGAMGTVYLGRDPKINRKVAIKTVRFEDDVDDAQMKAIKERFFREAESAGNLSHPNIIKIFDAGEDYDVSYIAMELLDGNDLKSYCEKDKLLPIKDAMEYVAKIADALDYAQQQGVVHRDIKPANIMLLKDGTLRVTDFGIARIMASSKTQTGTVLGTPSYMSPEQVAGKKVDGRSDLFSLGVVLYELLAGDKPFKGDSIATLIFQITNDQHPSPKTINDKIPDVCIKIIDKALAKDPEKRYQRGNEMAKDIRDAIATL